MTEEKKLDEVEELHKQNKENCDKIAECQKNLENIQFEYKEMLKAKDKEISIREEAQRNNTKLTEENSKLKKEIDDLKEKIKNSKITLRTTERNTIKYSEELNRYQKLEKENADKIGDLNRQIEKFKESEIALCDNLKKMKDDKENEIDGLNKIIEDEEKSKKNKDLEIENLKSLIHTKDSEIACKDQEIKEKTKCIEDLEHNKELCNSSSKELIDKINKIEFENKELTKKLSETKLKEEEFEDKYNKELISKQKYEKSYTETDELCKKIEEDLKIVTSEKENYLEQLDISNKKSTDLENDLNEMKTKEYYCSCENLNLRQFISEENKKFKTKELNLENLISNKDETIRRLNEEKEIMIKTHESKDEDMKKDLSNIYQENEQLKREIEKHEKNKTKLETRLEKLVKELEETKSEKDVVIDKFSSEKMEIQILNFKYESLAKENSKLLDQKEKLKEKIKTLKSQKKNEKNEKKLNLEMLIENLKREIYEKDSQLSLSNNSIDELTDSCKYLNEELERSKNIIISLTLELEEKDKMINECDLNNYRNLSFDECCDYNDLKLSKTFTDYDFIIDINKSSDIITKGWEISFPQVKINSTEEFKAVIGSKGKSNFFIGIIGGYGKGKTFLINKLINANLPSGKTYSTKGFSVIQSEISKGYKAMIIDTVGSEIPINNSKITLPERDNTDKNIRDLTVQTSDIIILVVNDFTTKDQQIIENIILDLILNKEKDLSI